MGEESGCELRRQRAKRDRVEKPLDPGTPQPGLCPSLTCPWSSPEKAPSSPQPLPLFSACPLLLWEEQTARV